MIRSRRRKRNRQTRFLNYAHRISALLLAAMAALSSPTLSAHPLSNQEAFFDEPTVAEGLLLLRRYASSNHAGTRASADALKAECWRAVEPETGNVDANIDACLNAAAKLLDPQALFIRHDSFGRATSALGGIGITLSKTTHSDSFVIVDVIPGTPAAASGVVRGDKVAGVDGQAVAGWTMTELLAKLRGKPGSNVELTLQREAQATVQRARIDGRHVELTVQEEAQPALKLSLQRALIPMQPIHEAPLKAGWYVQVHEFSQGVTDRFRSSLRRAAQAGTLQQALVLDLRGNGGGRVQEIVDLAQLLAPELEPLMYTVGPGGLDTVRAERWVGDDDDAEIRRRLDDLPFVVLTDRYTGSGSEWLVEVLRQRPRTWVLGERTAGIAKTGEAFEVGDVGWFKMPTGVLLPGRGMPLDGHGVVPDEERPAEPLRVAVPPDWLSPWLEAGTYRMQPPPRTSATTSAGAEPTACLGDMLLPPAWPSGLESTPSRSIAVRLRSSAGEFAFSQSDPPDPKQLNIMWAELREGTDEAKKSTSLHITQLAKRLRQPRLSRDDRAETEQRIGSLRRRLQDFGFHSLKQPGATLVITEAYEVVVWIRDQRLFYLNGRQMTPLPIRKKVYEDMLDRFIDSGTPTAATPTLCLLHGSLALKDGETATEWTYKAEWQSEDAQVFLTMLNEKGHAFDDALGGLRANLQQARSFDELLLTDGDTSWCASEPRAPAQLVFAPASFAGQPAVLRAASLDRTSTADEDPGDIPACRSVNVINRVPLDEKVHWHRFIRLATTSTNAPSADGQVQRWLNDFNAVSPRAMPATNGPK